ncbi:hypothetical protein KAR91_81560 [Candidatus Pacearchaeota archaeon]|nr:hypothetical protein [Candidatus Pacearchaeota archaeon]
MKLRLLEATLTQEKTFGLIELRIKGHVITNDKLKQFDKRKLLPETDFESIFEMAMDSMKESILKEIRKEGKNERNKEIQD